MKVSIVLALSALLLVGCATTFVVPEMDVGLGDMPADPVTFIELDSGIVLHQMDGEAVNKSGPLRIHCTPGPHELMVSYHAEWVVNGVRYTRSSGGALPLTVNVNEKKPRFVLDMSTLSALFEPQSLRYNPADYGQKKRESGVFSPSDDSPVAMLNGETVLYGKGSSVYLYWDAVEEGAGGSSKIYDFDQGTVIALSSDGDRAWALCSDGTLALLDPTDRTLQSSVSLGKELAAADIADGIVYASVAEGGLAAWSLDGRPMGNWATNGIFDEVVVRGGFLSAERKDHVAVVEIETGKLTEFAFDKGRAVRDARVDAIGRQMVVLFESQKFAVYDLVDGTEYPSVLRRLPVWMEKPAHFDISPDGTELVVMTEMIMVTGLYTCWVVLYELGDDPVERSVVGPGKYRANESWLFQGAYPRSVTFDDRLERIMAIGSAGVGPAYFLLRGTYFVEPDTIQVSE